MPLDEAFPESYAVVPVAYQRPVYFFDDYLTVVNMSASGKATLSHMCNGMGYIVNRATNMGNAILLSPEFVLVSGHCFKGDSCYLKFPAFGGLYRANLFYEGRLDFKILLLSRPIVAFNPARLSVSISCGRSLQLYYRADNKLRVKEYRSDDRGGYMSRSDLASVRTYYGESGAARYSLTQRAIHAIHQGESEGLTMNAIVNELTSVKRYRQEHSPGCAGRILATLNIVDLALLGLNASSIPIEPNVVTPEGPQQPLVVVDGLAFSTPNPLPNSNNFRDTCEALSQLDFSRLWGSSQSNPIASYQTVRIDIQNPSATHQNIQVQLNGVFHGNTTFATLLLDRRLAKVPYAEQRTHIFNKAAGALKNGVFEGRNHLKFVTKIIDLSWVIG